MANQWVEGKGIGAFLLTLMYLAGQSAIEQGSSLFQTRLYLHVPTCCPCATGNGALGPKATRLCPFPSIRGRQQLSSITRTIDILFAPFTKVLFFSLLLLSATYLLNFRSNYSDRSHSRSGFLNPVSISSRLRKLLLFTAILPDVAIFRFFRVCYTFSLNCFLYLPPLFFLHNHHTFQHQTLVKSYF